MINQSVYELTRKHEARLIPNLTRATPCFGYELSLLVCFVFRMIEEQQLFVSDLLTYDSFFGGRGGGKVLTYSAGCSLCYRQLETEMETVVKVLQPGPLGIIEHKFSAEEVRQASATVERAVQNWLRNAYQEQGSEILKDYIDK